MAGSLDNIVQVWDIQSRALIEPLMGHKDSMYSIMFMLDSKGLVSGSLDQTLKVESGVDKGAAAQVGGESQAEQHCEYTVNIPLTPLPRVRCAHSMQFQHTVLVPVNTIRDSPQCYP